MNECIRKLVCKYVILRLCLELIVIYIQSGVSFWEKLWMALEVITYTDNFVNQNIYDTLEFMNNQFRSLTSQESKYDPKKIQIHNA